MSEVGRELTSYWGLVYIVRQDEAADEEEFLSYVQEWHRPQWQWQRGETWELAADVRGSASGPSGLPHPWWATALPAARALLDAVAECMKSGADMPIAMRRSVTGSIP